MSSQPGTPVPFNPVETFNRIRAAFVSKDVTEIRVADAMPLYENYRPHANVTPEEVKIGLAMKRNSEKFTAELRGGVLYVTGKLGEELPKPTEKRDGVISLRRSVPTVVIWLPQGWNGPKTRGYSAAGNTW